MDEQRKREIEASLARARKTVAESRALVEQVNLRIQETDRFLAKQGLTREQLRHFQFTKEQRLLANEQLKRMGLPPIEEEDLDFDSATAAIRAEAEAGDAASDGDIVDERRRKFGNFMQGIRL